MADVTYRGNLSASYIPVDPLSAGRSVIMKGYDNQYAPNLASKADTDKDIGIPQIIYGANILPTEQGWRSVTFHHSVEGCPGTPYTAFPVRSATATTTLIHTEEGDLYRLDEGGTPQFVYVGNFPGVVSYATVSGTTYLFFRGTGAYTYDPVTDVITSTTLTGLTVSAILGIVGTSGYLLAWSEDAITWSSIFDPTDFVPSVDTGAGGGPVEAVRGAITVCVSNAQGILVFTENNCVAATLSNNATYPFNFKEIAGSSGVTSIQQVTVDGNANTTYAFTPTGFQQLSLNGAKTIWTDLSDNADVTPVWDENSALIEGYGTARGISGAKMVMIANRYVCISIANGTSYRDVWVFDAALQRWGRLVLQHLDVFESESHEIALLGTDGHITVVKNSNAPETGYHVDPDSAVIVLGKFQYSRQRLLQLQRIEIDNLFPVQQVDNLTGVIIEVAYPKVFVLSPVDGKNGVWNSTYRRSQIEYLYHKTGLNHSIMIKGCFYLSSLVLTFNNHGGR